MTEITQYDALAAEKEKSANYLNAILATSLAYTEANLTANTVLAHSLGPSKKLDSLRNLAPSPEDFPCYDAFQAWVAFNLVSSKRDKYLYISSRDHLLDCFAKGTARASVSFSIFADNEEELPCRAVFYLYSEQSTGDVHVLCVVYDLTEEQRREKELEELKVQLELSRIRSSASQMKPHFLYNALGSIQEVILCDPKRAAELLEDFTVYLRGCVKALDSDKPIPFSQELENIVAYANIEKMRLGRRLEIIYELEETGFKVLPLSIQPLVENAIRHGIHPLGKKGGAVALRTYSTEDEWIIEVVDTGQGFDINSYASMVNSDTNDSMGLRNIRFRLEKIMGATMNVASVKDAGTKVIVRIPRKDSLYESNNSR